MSKVVCKSIPSHNRSQNYSETRVHFRYVAFRCSADSQTGAVGDIEILGADGEVFEALEIKHAITIDETILTNVREKLMDRRVDRYYVLTTATRCTDGDLTESLRQIYAKLGCQVVINGVLPSLRYYLRLLEDPSQFFRSMRSC